MVKENMKRYLLLLLLIPMVSATIGYENIDYGVHWFTPEENITTTWTGNLTNLSQLQDTNIPAPTDEYVLTWDSATSKWIATNLNETGDIRWVNVDGDNMIGNLNVSGNIIADNLELVENLTLGQRITFDIGETIDNIVDGWIRITGGLDVSGDLKVDETDFYVNSTSGNVGIGTSDPDTKLQVVGDFKSGEDTTNYFSLASNGEVSLHGTARVEKILFFDLTRMKKGIGSPPAENVEDGFRTYDFDKTIDEEMFSSFSGPLEWAPGTDARFHLGFFVDTAPATAQNVVWGIEYKSIECDGVFDFSSGTTTVTDAVAITTGTPANDKKVHCANLIIPSAGLIEEGLLMVRVFRDTNHVNDTFDGDARMFNIHIHYLADKLGK